MKNKSIKALVAAITVCVSAIIVNQPVSAAQANTGLYRSEITNEWISSTIQTQRPIAAMVDNDKIALPHYGLTKADVVYEITNSLHNKGVTRFMAIYKDWGNITQLGSIRSVRPTNLQIAPEWNAVVCHDGGPFYINNFLALDYVENFSGTFARIPNGKAREFTEYIAAGDLARNFAKKQYSTQYNKYYPGPHYKFAPDETPTNLSVYPEAIACNRINLPYKNNKPFLAYDAASDTYKYSEYGKAHLDPGNNNLQLSFKNLLIQNTTYQALDANGYMMFNSIDAGRSGFFITGGKAIPVTWTKTTDLSPTRYYDSKGNEIMLNTGKTYVAMVPDDIWAELTIQ